MTMSMFTCPHQDLLRSDILLLTGKDIMEVVNNGGAEGTLVTQDLVIIRGGVGGINLVICRLHITISVIAVGVGIGIVIRTD